MLDNSDRFSRRRFLRLAGLTGIASGFVGCGPAELQRLEQAATGDTVTMYDTYAVALYFDGTQGPFTGIIYVDYVLAGDPVTIDFWHGHGGQLHQYTVLPEHYDLLKQGERVYIETTEVQNHSHQLFIDPLDPEYRVPGSEPVEVPLDDEQDPGGEPPAFDWAPIQVDLPGNLPYLKP